MRFPERCLEKITQKASLISPESMTHMNSTMRLLREQLNLSIQEVADATGLSFRTILRAEQGASLNPESRRRLCQFYGKTSEELGLIPRSRNGTYHQHLQEQT